MKQSKKRISRNFIATKKAVTLTVGIPAYNEQVNINSLLRSLMQQKNNGFLLENVVIYSDASTDKTDEIVKNFSKKHPIIQLVKDTTRKGKYYRVNQMFKNCGSDILVVLDADIVLVGNEFLEKLVSTLSNDPDAQMVAAHQIPLRPENFIGKIIYTSFAYWDFVRLGIPGYDSPYNFLGAATAYRGNFVRSIDISSDISNPHLYIYLKAKKINGFRYNFQATIIYRIYETLEDLLKFMNRSIGKKDVALEKVFDADFIKDIYSIPKQYKYRGMLQCFIQYPLYTPLAMLVSAFIAKCAPAKKVNDSPMWDIALSSKKPIAHI